MPARAGNTTYVPGRGSTTVKPSGQKTFQGKGPAPAGAQKQPEATYQTAPTVTRSPTGQVSTSGFNSQAAAAQAKRAAAASRQRTLGIVRKLQASPQKGLEPKPPAKPLSYKPATFQGKPTAGTPTIAELRSANQTGVLKENKRGYLTTPAVREASGALAKAQKAVAAAKPTFPGLEPEQAKVARTVLSTGKKQGANRKELLSAAETGVVESNLRNLPGGTGTSKGWRQETAESFPNVNRMNVKGGAQRYFQEAQAKGRGQGQTAGELAQVVQGSAYPARYQEAKSKAVPILRDFLHAKPAPKAKQEMQQAVAREASLGLQGGKKKREEPLAPQIVSRFRAGKQAINELVKAKLPYVWGGGHGAPHSEPTGGTAGGTKGLDCSGTVSYILNKMGVMKGSLVSGEMGSVLKPGPGAVTVFYNAEHTFMHYGNKYVGTSDSNQQGGAGIINPSVAKSEIASGNSAGAFKVGHVAGLGQKQAVALGIKIGPTGSGGSFPGMTMGPSGTTATISPGAGVEVHQPTVSSKPISPAQRIKQTFANLERLGVGVTPGKAKVKVAQPSSELERLEQKYGA